MKTDVAIIGGGPGGAASAVFLAREGIQSIIIEKETFPRFHIGESMTGECGNITRDLGLEEEMMKRGHPVKHGVEVFGKDGNNTFWVPVMRRDENNKLEKNITWQVRRSEFDQMVLNQALAQGATRLKGQATKALQNEDGSVRGVEVRLENGNVEEIEAKVVIDASGAATFLANSGIIGPKERGNYDRQFAVFSHVKGALRGEEDNTLIFYEERNHWAWFIPIDAETVSVGVVTPSDYFKSNNESLHEFYMREIQKINPELATRMANAELVEEVRATSNYSYHIKKFTGKGYLCVGDSHRFVDPIFSFGLHFALTEARMAAETIADYLQNNASGDGNPFANYENKAELGMDTIEGLVDCFWENPLAFAFFVHSRYTDDFIDLFSGRVYQDPPSRGLQAIHTVNAQAKLRDG